MDALLLELALPGTDLDRVGPTVAAAVLAQGRRAWPVVFTPGREERSLLTRRTKRYPSELWLPDKRPELSRTEGVEGLLADDAMRDAAYIAMSPSALEALAISVAIIADHATAGLDLRATWPGSPIQQTVGVTLPELLAQIRASRLCEFTRYRVTT